VRLDVRLSCDLANVPPAATDAFKASADRVLNAAFERVKQLAAACASAAESPQPVEARRACRGRHSLAARCAGAVSEAAAGVASLLIVAEMERAEAERLVGVGFANLALGDRVEPVLEALIRAGGSRLSGVRYSVGYDALSHLDWAVTATCAHRGDAGDELDLADWTHLDRPVGAIHRAAFLEDCRDDVVAGVEVIEQFQQQVSPAAAVPQMMMRIDGSSGSRIGSFSCFESHASSGLPDAVRRPAAAGARGH
jgi:hypothetical protein